MRESTSVPDSCSSSRHSGSASCASSTHSVSSYAKRKMRDAPWLDPTVVADLELLEHGDVAAGPPSAQADARPITPAPTTTTSSSGGHGRLRGRGRVRSASG